MRKTILLAALFAFTFSFQADAQMKVKKIGVSLGQDWDMLPSLSKDMLLSKTDGRMTNSLSSSFDLDNSSQYSGVCENPNLRATLVLEPQRWSNVELHTSGVFIFNRIDAIYLSDNDNEGYNYADIEMRSNEIGLEGVLLKKVPVFGWNALNLYGGVGTNLGYQFGNSLYARTSQTEYNPIRPSDRYTEEIHESSINNGISARVFGQAGIGVTFFNRVELGLEGRYGAGFRHYAGTDTDFSNLRSIALNMKYVLKG